MPPPPPRRIRIRGTSGAGKTTLARALAQRLGLPHTEVDRLYWRPGWTPPDPDAFRAQIADVVARDAWVVDANYSSVADLFDARTELIVWLDYRLPLVMTRCLRRTLRRVRADTPTFPGCPETWRKQFLTRDSILCWTLTTHRRRHREALQQEANPPPGVRVLRFRRPRDTARWLANLNASPSPRDA